MEIAERKIRAIRINKNYTQEKVAELSGVSRSQIQRIEGGDVDPKMSTLSKLAKGLDCSVNDFIVEKSE